MRPLARSTSSITRPSAGSTKKSICAVRDAAASKSPAPTAATLARSPAAIS